MTRKKTAAAAAAVAPPPVPRDPRDAFLSGLMGSYTSLREQTRDAMAKLQRGDDTSAYSIAYELRWSAGLFARAAEAGVQESILREVWKREGTDNPVTLAHIRKHILDRAIRGARFPENSTSPASNLVQQLETAEWARLLGSRLLEDA